MSNNPFDQNSSAPRRNERADIGTDPKKTEQIEELKRQQRESELRKRESDSKPPTK